MNKKLITGAAGVALASIVGLGMALPSQAQTSTITASAFTAGDTGSSSHDGAQRGHGGKGFDAAALATKLGLTEAAVADAVAAVRDGIEPGTRPSEDATEAEREAAKDARQTAFATALASELNIDEATVTAALTEIRTEKQAERTAERKASLDQAVADGTLTQAEADAVQKAIDAGVMGPRNGGRGQH
jgi:predicted flavoprotein YhiN